MNVPTPLTGVLQEAAHKILVRVSSHSLLSLRLMLLQGSSFATGLEMQDKRKRVLWISTGSKAVDAILGGVPTRRFLTFLADLSGRWYLVPVHYRR
jgi:hypothetical protein